MSRLKTSSRDMPSQSTCDNASLLSRRQMLFRSAASAGAMVAGKILTACSGLESRQMDEVSSCSSTHTVCGSTNYTSYFRQGDTFTPPNASHLIVEVTQVREIEHADSENLWTNNRVTITVTDSRNGRIRTETLLSNRGDSIELDDNISIIAGWAMAVENPSNERPENYGDGDPKAEIIVVNRNSVEATVTRNGVDESVCAEDSDLPTSVEVTFSEDICPLFVEGYRHLDTGIIGERIIANIEISEDGPTRIALGELEGVGLVEIGGTLRLGREFNLDVSEGDAYDRSNRLWANVGINAVNNSPLLDAEDPQYNLPRFVMSGAHKAAFIYTANDITYIAHLLVTSSETDAMAPAVHASIVKVTEEIYDGQIIAVDGVSYQVGISLNEDGNAIQSINFRRL